MSFWNNPTNKCITEIEAKCSYIPMLITLYYYNSVWYWVTPDDSSISTSISNNGIFKSLSTLQSHLINQSNYNYNNTRIMQPSYIFKAYNLTSVFTSSGTANAFNDEDAYYATSASYMTSTNYRGALESLEFIDFYKSTSTRIYLYHLKLIFELYSGSYRITPSLTETILQTSPLLIDINTYTN